GRATVEGVTDVTVGGGGRDCLLSVDLYARRRFDRFFASARCSLEPTILLDRQSSMENIAFNDTGAIYSNAVGADGALKVAANCQFLCDDVTHHLCAFGDHNIRGVYLTLDATKNSQGPTADNLADYRK